ncbi:MAG: hypothetical protein ACR2N6_05860 [Miltoncostaeaceae bacterium]
MTTDPQRLHGILGHPVAVTLDRDDDGPVVAGSVAGEPPRARVAWVGREADEVVARVACPPGRPSRWRPLVACSVRLSGPDISSDHLLVARLAPEAAALRAHVAGEDVERDAVPAGAEGLVLVPLPEEAAVVAVDALDDRGEPIGRIVRAGISELRADGGTISGRLGASHGMGAGIGHGRWASGLPEAAFEAGYQPWLPGWLPSGLARQEPRVEPDIAYPAAPPALIVAWTGQDGARVLLRQAPAPLASPETGAHGARKVDIGGVEGMLRGRRLVTVVWETPERAFGVQVRGMSGAEDVALRVARSVGPENLPE